MSQPQRKKQRAGDELPPPPPTSAVSGAGRSYEDAVSCLFSTQHRGAKLVSSAAQRKRTIVHMQAYLRRLCSFADPALTQGFLGHWRELPVIHVAGTKGVVWAAHACGLLDTRAMGVLTSL